MNHLQVQKSSHGCWSRHNAFLPRADDNVKKIETPLCPSDFCALQRHKQRNSHKEAKLTQMLLIISAVFVVLNVPDHVGRAIELANTLSGKVDENESDSTEIARGIARLMYYTSFSVNFFLYNLVGNSFRKNLKELLNKIIAKLACKDFEMNGNSSAADTYVSNLNSFRNRFNPTRRRNSSLTQLSKNHSIIKEMTPLSSSTVGVSDVYL